jgi:lipopolysaccharide export LptBFGC system permease protein LptF
MFIHTLAEKIKEDSFPLIGGGLIQVLIQICNNLPCPECAQHAKQFWAKVKTTNIKTKAELINLLFVFHNIVNKRKHIQLFKHENLTIYKPQNLIQTYNMFSRNFNTRGNMNLITDSFRREIMLKSLRKWLMTNILHFEL